MDLKLKRSNIQRLIALKNAFEIIDAFEIPSMNPEDDENYEKIKKSLIKNYSEGINEGECEKYTTKKLGMYGEMPKIKIGTYTICMMSNKENEDRVWIEDEGCGEGSEFKADTLEPVIKEFFDKNF